MESFFFDKKGERGRDDEEAEDIDPKGKEGRGDADRWRRREGGSKVERFGLSFLFLSRLLFLSRHDLSLQAEKGVRSCCILLHNRPNLMRPTSHPSSFLLIRVHLRPSHLLFLDLQGSKDLIPEREKLG